MGGGHGFITNYRIVEGFWVVVTVLSRIIELLRVFGWWSRFYHELSNCRIVEVFGWWSQFYHELSNYRIVKGFVCKHITELAKLLCNEQSPLGRKVTGRKCVIALVGLLGEV